MPVSRAHSGISISTREGLPHCTGTTGRAGADLAATSIMPRDAKNQESHSALTIRTKVPPIHPPISNIGFLRLDLSQPFHAADVDHPQCQGKNCTRRLPPNSTLLR